MPGPVAGLARRWDPVKARDLATDLRHEPNTVSAQLNKLVKDGWAEKVKQGRKATYQLRERFYNIFYLMRHGRSEAERLRSLLRFMKTMYSEGELGRAEQELQTIGPWADDPSEGQNDHPTSRRIHAQVRSLLGQLLCFVGKPWEALSHLEALLALTEPQGHANDAELQSNQDETIVPALHFVEDDEQVEPEITTLAITLAAIGHAHEVRRLLRARGTATRWEPLLVALEASSEPDSDILKEVAQEIVDVARDIMRTIHEYQAMIQGMATDTALPGGIEQSHLIRSNPTSSGHDGGTASIRPGPDGRICSASGSMAGSCAENVAGQKGQSGEERIGKETV